MYINGVVIQRYADNAYKGIDGSGYSENTGLNWFFNDDDDAAGGFEPYYDENIGRTYYDIPDSSWIGACNDLGYIKKYADEAEKRGIRYRLLLCETDIPAPIFDCPEVEKKFLGYDYAYSTFDNYSAVYNEVPNVFPQFTLNENGLFQTREEIDAYIAERERFKQCHPPLTLEEGDFVVYRLHEIYLK